jgi:hypothetical protein
MTGTARMRPIPRHFPDDDPAEYVDAVPGYRDEAPAWKDPVLSKELPAPDDLPPAATVAASEMGDEDFWSLIRGGPRR